MEDREIVSLYFDRNMRAIEETSLKYRSYCTSVAVNILGNNEDAEECMNDALHSIWNSIPPENPENLRTYIGKIIRNISFDRYRKNSAKKRGGGETSVVLDEISGILSGKDTPETEIDRKELANAISSFLRGIAKDRRSIFVMRYWYAMNVSDIAKKTGKSESNISVILNRMRGLLKTYLVERGYEL